MPTTRPRHFVTESDELREALDEAARQSPNLTRAQLLVQLALEGHRAAEHRREKRHQQRLDAVRTHSGSLTGVYPPDYLENLREDWPE